MADALYDLIKITYTNKTGVEIKATLMNELQERELIISIPETKIYIKIGNKLYTVATLVEVV